MGLWVIFDFEDNAILWRPLESYYYRSTGDTIKIFFLFFINQQRLLATSVQNPDQDAKQKALGMKRKSNIIREHFPKELLPSSLQTQYHLEKHTLYQQSGHRLIQF